MATPLTETMTLREIAVIHPPAVACLERLGLDYCCGGHATLADAATKRGLDPSVVLDELRAAEHRTTEDVRDWSGATMTELADHIEQTHHAYVRDALDRLAGMMPKVAKAHGPVHPELIELVGVVAAFTDDMHDHMVREERVLFPWLRRLERRTEIQSGPPWSVRRPIDCMVHDHDEAGRALETMRRLTSGYTPPADACPTLTELYRLLEELERDTHLHIHKENNILFPAGVEAEKRLEAAGARRTEAARPGGFTLIELLVVLAIIALLISIMLPALGMARESGQSVVCLSNTRSIAVAMAMYADEDRDEMFPTARMPGMAMGGNPAAPFRMSWIYLLAPYLGADQTLPADPSNEDIARFVGRMGVCQCPSDHSENWESVMMPRLASYGINAYLTPNHPPHWGVRASQIAFPTRTVLGAELTEELAMDHFMPMYWGDPPAVSNPMIQMRQWDPETQRPRVIQHTRHNGERANYVFTDGHARAHPFGDTWAQTPGEAPTTDWYDPF